MSRVPDLDYFLEDDDQPTIDEIVEAVKQVRKEMSEELKQHPPQQFRDKGNGD